MSSTKLIVFILLFGFFTVEIICKSKESFSEELLFTRLPSGHLLSHFQFTTKWDVNGEENLTHFNLFPKSLTEIIQEFNVIELHLTLTQGLWHHDTWGHPYTSAPAGVQLWVWFDEKLDETEVEKNWVKLINALSGQLCASINFITSSISTKPELSFRPMGVRSSDSKTKVANLRYAHLPKENVCTENLTPWKKLLPCVDKAGLATLLNAVRLFDTSYNAIGLHFQRICRSPECHEMSFQLQQSISVVFDPYIAGILKGWHLIKLFNSELSSTCPMADESKVYIEIPQDMLKSEKVTPEPTETITKRINGKPIQVHSYDLKQTITFRFMTFVRCDIITTLAFAFPLNIASQYAAVQKKGAINPSSIRAHRFLTGYGEEYGGITCLIHNTDKLSSIKVIYFDVLPWYVRPFLHTLKVRLGSKNLDKEKFSFIPAKDRQRPSTMEMVLDIPPSSTIEISIDFEKAFMKWTEYPPDTHHGFHVSPAVITTVLPDAKNITGIATKCLFTTRSSDCEDKSSLFVRIYTEPLLVVLPTPDFSMPYNVICLTCTVVAIGFGTLYNITTRSFTVIPLKTAKLTIKERIRNLFKKTEDANESKKQR